jgi:CRP/FNR family transcriptional regulator
MSENKKLFKAGSYIYIEEDEDIDEIYLLKSGEIRLETMNKKSPLNNERIHNGDIFGFISSLGSRPRTESALAVVDSEVYCFSKKNFLSLLSQNWDISVKLINYFADKLRTYDEMIFSWTGKEEDVDVDINLFNLGKYYYNKAVYENAYYILWKYLQLHPGSSNTDSAKKILDAIEKNGFRAVIEPIKEGNYYNYADKQVIFCEDEPGDELYVIMQGQVKIVKYHNGTEIMLSVMDPGDIFGELAIVSDKTRNATAISFGACKLLPISKESLQRMLNEKPKILKKIFTSISLRVWFTYIRIEAKLFVHPTTRLYAFLVNKLHEEKISLKSNEPFEYNFGIDEILEMNGISKKNIKNSINDFLNDANFTFKKGKILINSPAELSARARYFRTIDHNT